MSDKEFSFSVDSAVLSELGERLVSSTHLALCELIKNSYDADASLCEVSIASLDEDRVTITIKDDGTGMSVQDIEKYWMRIGTTHKRDIPLSPRYGRLRTGRKGIGRFCCRKLGEQLVIETVIRSGNTYNSTSIDLDWTDFTAGSAIEGIPIHGRTKSDKGFTNGTTLAITGDTGGEWSDKNLNYIRRQMSVLVANQGSHRDGYEMDPGFSLRLVVDDQEQDVADLRDAVINAGWGTLTAYVDEVGKAHYTLDAEGMKKSYTSAAEYSHISGVKLKVGIIPLDKSQFRNVNVLSLEKAREIFENWSGIQVKYNGFRVFPYGDTYDDWLFITKDRSRRLGKPREDLFSIAEKNVIDPARVLLKGLSNQSYFGAVTIESTVQGLEMKVDRMGFIENEIFEEVRKMVRTGVDWTTIMREHWLQKRERIEREQIEKEFIDLTQDEDETNSRIKDPAEVTQRAIEVVEKKLEATLQLLPPNERAKSRETTQKALKLIKSVTTDDQKILHKYRVMVSAASITLIFAHEVRSVMGLLNQTAQQLKVFEVNHPDVFKDGKSPLPERLRATTQRFEELLNLANIVALPSEAEKKIALNVKTNVEKAADVFALILDAYNIELITTEITPWNLATKEMLQSEFLAIVINALSNAVKAVIAGGGKKRVSISAKRVGQSIQLSIKDSGIGLDKQFHEDAFTELVSDPQRNFYSALNANLDPSDKTILGSGSGFGLNIIGSLAKSNGGSAQFVDVGSDWSTNLQITI